MTVVPKRRPLYRRPEEIGRRVVAFMLEFTFKAYAVAAAVSVALSDAESLGGKAYDGLKAVPNLIERYRQAKFVADHREQIQAAVDYANEHAVGPEQLDAAIQKSSRTIDRIKTTIGEVEKAQDAFFSIRPTNLLDSIPEVKEHVEAAWAVHPSLESIDELLEDADKAATFLNQLDLQDPYVQGVYADLLRVMDNFASDEIGATLGVMAAAFALAYALGMGFGFWGRRGRPGFVAWTLQRWGTRRFGDWYVANLEYALGRPLYAVARKRIQRDILADPRKTLDPEAFQELARYFEREYR